LYSLVRQVHACIRADFRERIPLIHSKFSHADVDVQTVVVLGVDLSFRKVILHLLVCPFAIFNLLDQFPSRLCKVAHAAGNEAFPPQMLLCVCAFWPFSGAYAYENANFAPRQFVANSFVESHRRWVVFAGAFIEKDRLADLDWLEC